jgi:hypothetical protein
VKGVVAAAIDGFGPLCDVVAAETMVARTDDDKVGIEEFSEEVTTFVSIVV